MLENGVREFSLEKLEKLKLSHRLKIWSGNFLLGHFVDRDELGADFLFRIQFDQCVDQD